MFIINVCAIGGVDLESLTAGAGTAPLPDNKVQNKVENLVDTEISDNGPF